MAKNNLLRRVVGNFDAQRGADRPKVKIPDPKELNGVRSAKKLEKLLVPYGAVHSCCPCAR